MLSCLVSTVRTYESSVIEKKYAKSREGKNKHFYKLDTCLLVNPTGYHEGLRVRIGKDGAGNFEERLFGGSDDILDSI